MNESTFRKKLCKELRTIGAVVLPIVGNAAMYAGTPDVYCSHNVWHGFIEFKGKATKLRAIQTRVMENLIVTGTSCFVVRCPCNIQSPAGEDLDSFNDAWDLLKKLLELSRENLEVRS